MGLGNWKIGARLAAGFGMSLVFMIGLSVIGITNLNRVDGATGDLAADKVPKVIESYEIIGCVNDIARAMRNAVLSTDPATVKKELQRITDKKVEIGARLDKLDKLIADDADPQGSAKLKAVREARERYIDMQVKFVAMSSDPDKRDESIKFLLTTVRQVQAAYMDTLQDLVKYQTSAVNQTATDAHATYQSVRNMMIALTVLAAALASAVLYWITRSITQPLHRAVGVAEAVAGGDLTQQIDADTTDETGQLLRALRNMNESLVHTVGRVRSGSDTINTATNEIANGNLDLSSRTETQASSLEETASSMEQLTSTVTQNADNARQATALVVAASDFATKGGKVVGEVVATMGAIKESSNKIVDIIAVIDGIAFQTNILALNAAVEAARAGEQGRGFAVVASEVRGLAQRSAAAAKEIKELINRSVETVDTGARLVDEAGNTMGGIVTAVKQVADIMSEISAASQEQSSGIAQVNEAIVQIDDATQQNAALVEQAAAAAQSLREQAQLLADAVSVFRIAGSQAAAPRVAAPARKPDRPVLKVVPPPARKAAAAAAEQDDWQEF